jgi:hypothetical protein
VTSAQRLVAVFWSDEPDAVQTISEEVEHDARTRDEPSDELDGAIQRSGKDAGEIVYVEAVEF